MLFFNAKEKQTLIEVPKKEIQSVLQYYIDRKQWITEVILLEETFLVLLQSGGEIEEQRVLLSEHIVEDYVLKLTSLVYYGTGYLQVHTRTSILDRVDIRAFSKNDDSLTESLNNWIVPLYIGGTPGEIVCCNGIFTDYTVYTRTEQIRDLSVLQGEWKGPELVTGVVPYEDGWLVCLSRIREYDFANDDTFLQLIISKDTYDESDFETFTRTTGLWLTFLSYVNGELLMGFSVSEKKWLAAPPEDMNEIYEMFKESIGSVMLKEGKEEKDEEPEEVLDDEEFEKLLDEFCEKELNAENTENDYELDIDLGVKYTPYINLFIDDSSEIIPVAGSRKAFVKGEGYKFIHITFSFCPKKSCKKRVRIVIYNDMDEFVASYDAGVFRFDGNPAGDEISITVPCPKKIGKYRLCVWVDDEKANSKSFFLWGIPAGYANCIEVKEVSVTRQSGGGENLVALDKKSNCNLYICLEAESRLLGSWIPDFIFVLKDDKEHLLDSDIVSVDVWGGESRLVVEACVKQSCKIRSLKNYSLEIYLMDERVARIPLQASDKDIAGELDIRKVLEPCSLYNSEKAEEQLFAPWERLKEMHGMELLKEDTLNNIKYLRYNRFRKRSNEECLPLPLHSVFVGNKGTGKSSAARLLGKLYHELGLLSTGQFHCCNARELQEIPFNYQDKTGEAINNASGGVLYIENAELLCVRADNRDTSPLGIETLSVRLRDKDDVLVILSGNYGPVMEMLNAYETAGSVFRHVYRFEDLDANVLTDIARKYLASHLYGITPEAENILYNHLCQHYSLRGPGFNNGHYIGNLFESEILPRLARRIVDENKCDDEKARNIIEACDIPCVEIKNPERMFEKLSGLIGLKKIKESVRDHLNQVRMNKIRADRGLFNRMPALHMVFTGNPGTGKTTVAKLIGEIYHAMGVLSSGHVVQVDRSKLVGQYIGDTEANTRQALERAKGGVLFIDEAYSLSVSGNDKKDFGNRVIETLLTTLDQENCDMIAILAGYPKEMELMIASNPGLKSRFPNVFYFEDYDPDELMQIADYVLKKEQYVFSSAARGKFQELVYNEYREKDEHFGNARYVTRLITTYVLKNMSRRLASVSSDELTDEMLRTIEEADIPDAIEKEKTRSYHFDEKLLSESLQRLDKMVGLEKVKSAIHSYVKVSRMLNDGNKAFVGSRVLTWSFAGNTGTGKSTVAAILSQILKGMDVLEKGHIVEVHLEELCNLPTYQITEMLRKDLKLAKGGLLFIDGDAPLLKDTKMTLDNEQLRLLILRLAKEQSGNIAVVIAETESLRQKLVQTLADSGVTGFDHTFIFDDYSEKELVEILMQALRERALEPDEAAFEILSRYIRGICESRELGYANARIMKLLARTIVQRTRLRLCDSQRMEGNMLIIREDVECFVWKHIAGQRKKVGFEKKARSVD